MSLHILSGAAARDRRVAGAKGAVLAELADAFPVPPFFVIAADAFGPAGIEPGIGAALEAAMARLGPGPFAVRSSGVEEDGAASAHAGQFETRLDVAGPDVAAAAVAVWRSGFTDSLAAYRRARGLSGAPQPPAVVVQRMVAARAAGVAFTADPVSGERVVVIGAVKGLGDRLVAGEDDGDTYRVGPGGDWLDGPKFGALSCDEVSAVAALARRAELWFGAPQDIEWAIEGGRLYLLQSRPITVLPVQDWREVAVWDNSNIVESYPGVVSPFTFSFARRIYGHVYRAFVGLLGVSDTTIAEHRATFDILLGRVEGRVYYNLAAWRRALALLPGFRSNSVWMDQMMGVSQPLPAGLLEHIAPAAETAGARVLGRARLALAVVRLAGLNLVLPAIRRRFQARLDAALAEPDEAIAALSASALAARYRRLESQLLERWDAPLINDFMCMIAFGLSRKILELWAGAAGLAAHAELMIGQGDIVSAEPARRIRAMGANARGRAELIARLEVGDIAAARADPALGPALAAYLARFGDRCTGELKLESPTLHDDARPLLAAIAAAARAAPEAVGRREPSDPLAPLFDGRPLKGFLARRLALWAKARVRDRENLRFERTRLFGRVRRIVRASGLRLAQAGLIDRAEDIFLLTVEEWLGAVEGGAPDRNLKGLTALRRTEQARDLARPEPPERILVRGGFLAGLPAALTAAQGRAVDGSDSARVGQACCAGVVEGRVRVIADPRLETLQPGEILVARSTDPGWIAVFANAAGVIAERGSLLSHSAIVAREMGVPCVVALKDATTWLKTGDWIRLDGAAGLVERLESNP
jgi:pyruvate,water dikinase